MPAFYKGALIFKRNPNLYCFNAARDFFETYYHCKPFKAEPEIQGKGGVKRIAVPKRIPFYFSSDSLPRIPGWLRELEHDCKAEEDGNDLAMLFLADEMERLFEAKVVYERFEPSIGDPDALRALTELEKTQRFQRPSEKQKVGNRDDAAPKRRPRAVDERKLEAALADLDALIGLKQVKEQLHNIVAIVRNRGAESLPCLHMLFVGNPGTGKTEVARILGRILAALGATADAERFVEADRSTLVGRYVGETAQKTKEVIAKASGGVLFIDEAYSLGLYGQDLGAGPDGLGGRRDFGPEAIDALVKEMEDHRGDFTCIMAGYPREMETMVSLNPGLRDRIGFKIEFPDYDAEELFAIFEKMVEDKGYRLSLLAQELAYEHVSELGRGKGYDFGNARLMRKIAERAIFKQNVRTMGDIIVREDVEAAFADGDLAELKAAPKPAIGFCA